VLGLGIQRGGRLVEDQQEWGGPHHGAPEGELLPLAAGQLRAANEAGAQLRLQAGRERGDDVTRLGPIESRLHRGRVVQLGQAPDADALARQQLEAGEVLEAGRGPLAPAAGGERPQVGAVSSDAPGGRLVEAGQELDQSRLAMAPSQARS
jgi:hypothetical protein